MANSAIPRGSLVKKATDKPGAALKRLRAKVDRAESAKVRERSGGHCEFDGAWFGKCLYEATEIHHMEGGWRLRGRNRSALAEAKQHLCRTHHRDITEHRVERIGGVVPLWTDKYRRVN